MAILKVAVVHLLPAPYRIPLFERLLEDANLDVRLFFTDRKAPNRPTWDMGTIPVDSRTIMLPEISVPLFMKRGDVLRLNLGLSKVFNWKPDVVLVYGHNELTNILVAFICIAKRIPYAFFAEVSGSADWSTLRRLSETLMSVLVRKAAVLVPASESCGRFFSRLGGSDNRMELIPCIPDVSGLRSRAEGSTARRDALRASAGLSDRFVVLFVGRLVEHKGVRDLVMAASEMQRRDPRVVILFVGYGPLDEYVRTECSRMSGSASYIGFVDDNRLMELYAVADIHIMPSWDEPYGVVCAEALTLGIPSIVTDTSGCVDLIEHGVNGFVIHSRSPREIVDCIVAVSKNAPYHAQMMTNAKLSMDKLTIDCLYARLRRVIQRAPVAKDQ